MSYQPDMVLTFGSVLGKFGIILIRGFSGMLEIVKRFVFCGIVRWLKINP